MVLEELGVGVVREVEERMMSSSYFCEAWCDNRECYMVRIFCLFGILAVLFGYGIIDSHTTEVNSIIIVVE